MPDPRVGALRAALRTHRPGNAREHDSVATILAELGRLPRPFDRTADPVHVTASAVVIGPRGVLLHRHKRLGIWLQPGGHIDATEAPHDAAVRETREETGITGAHPASGPYLLHVDVHDVVTGHRHLDLRYLLRAGAADPAPGDGESQDVAWFQQPAAVAIADPGLVGALAALERAPALP